jgi:hypothetical protein
MSRGIPNGVRIMHGNYGYRSISHNRSTPLGALHPYGPLFRKSGIKCAGPLDELRFIHRSPAYLHLPDRLSDRPELSWRSAGVLSVEMSEGLRLAHERSRQRLVWRVKMLVQTSLVIATVHASKRA